MNERPTHAEIDEANSTHAQNLEEQEVLKLAKEIGMHFVEATEAYPSMIRTYDHQLVGFASKLREKDVATIAKRDELIAKKNAELAAWDCIIDDMEVAVSCINPREDMRRAIEALKEEIASLKAQLAANRRDESSDGELYANASALAVMKENEKLKADVARLRNLILELEHLAVAPGWLATYRHDFETALSTTDEASDTWLKERDAKVLEEVACELDESKCASTGPAWYVRHITKKAAELRASTSKQEK